MTIKVFEKDSYCIFLWIEAIPGTRRISRGRVELWSFCYSLVMSQLQRTSATTW